MRLDLVAVAEGVTHDARGALTAVALNQRVFVQPNPVAPLSCNVLAIVSDEDDGGFTEPVEHTVRVIVRGPQGEERTRVEQSISPVAKRFAALPQFSQVVLDFQLLPDTPGAQAVEVALLVEGAPVEAVTRRLYVVSQSEAAQHPQAGRPSSVAR